MSEVTNRQFRARHRGRGAQVWIYLGKLLRMFVYQSDWKVLPMAALIAGLVGMVIRKKMYMNMEGTIMGSFALVCVCIWNGCFNSIQVICRERDVIKREHRSGMHISSYIFSHMLYQALLCLMQTGVTLYVTKLVGVRYDEATPLFTQWFIVDLGISMFLIVYASDMLSLWVSTLARTTTTAMTIMPFVLIFQLVFSGGMLTLPAWTEPLTHFTISNPGLKVIAAQADTNRRKFVTISNMVDKMRNNEVGGTVTLGQALDLLSDKENPAVAEIRAMEIGRVFTVGEIRDLLEKSEAFNQLKAEHVLDDITVGDVIKAILEQDALKPLREYSVPKINITIGEAVALLQGVDGVKNMADTKITRLTTVGDLLDMIDAADIMEQYKDMELGGVTTVGEAVDWLAGLDDVQAQRDKRFTLKTTLGRLIDLVGEKNVKDFLEEKAAAASFKADYEYTGENVVNYWLRLINFILAFALLSTVTLEFIDKDKR